MQDTQDRLILLASITAAFQRLHKVTPANSMQAIYAQSAYFVTHIGYLTLVNNPDARYEVAGQINGVSMVINGAFVLPDLRIYSCTLVALIDSAYNLVRGDSLVLEWAALVADQIKAVDTLTAEFMAAGASPAEPRVFTANPNAGLEAVKAASETLYRDLSS